VGGLSSIVHGKLLIAAIPKNIIYMNKPVDYESGTGAALRLLRGAVDDHPGSACASTRRARPLINSMYE